MPRKRLLLPLLLLLGSVTSRFADDVIDVASLLDDISDVTSLRLFNDVTSSEVATLTTLFPSTTTQR